MTSASQTKTINSISENLKAYKAEIRDKKLESDIKELDSLLETLKKQKDANTVIGNFTKRMSQKMDTAFNPTTYIRAVMPKFMKTWHENLNEYDKRRKAIQQRESLIKKQHQKEVAEVQKELDDLIKNDDKLKAIFKHYGKEAAQQAALRRQEQAAMDQAEKELADEWEKINDRLESISQDAELEWHRRNGVQLVKISKDAPTLEELEKIKEELKEKIEADQTEAIAKRQEKYMAAAHEKFKKEQMLDKRNRLKASANSSSAVKAKEGNSLLDSLVQGGLTGFITAIVPYLIKGGLIAALALGVEKYIKDPEFREKVNGVIKKLLSTILEFMRAHWKGVLLALAVLYPFKTLSVIGALALELYDILAITAGRISKIIFPPAIGNDCDCADLPDKDKKKDNKGKQPEKKPEEKKQEEKKKTNKDKARENKERKKEKRKEQAEQRKQEKAEREKNNKPEGKPSGDKPQQPNKTEKLGDKVGNEGKKRVLKVAIQKAIARFLALKTVEWIPILGEIVLIGDMAYNGWTIYEAMQELDKLEEEARKRGEPPDPEIKALKDQWKDLLKLDTKDAPNITYDATGAVVHNWSIDENPGYQPKASGEPVAVPPAKDTSKDIVANSKIKVIRMSERAKEQVLEAMLRPSYT